MTDKPILFSGSMVRALLDGRKTQTRRVLKPQPDVSVISAPFHPEHRGGRKWIFMARDDAPGYSFATADFAVPYAPGDRLWVREAVRFDAEWDDCSPRSFDRADARHYEADGAQETALWGDPFNPGRIRPSIHMPRWASRLTLTVTDVRVHRVQEINHHDARDEGVQPNGKGATPVDQFRDLWDSLNAKRGFGWDVNPWVVAITFTVHRKNIDEVAA